MGRKNRRRRRKPPLMPWSQEPELNHGTLVPHRSRCAFCGRPLRSGGWYWMTDEFGQRVKKCKDERGCWARRRDEAEESYREALRRNAERRGYWKERDDGE